MSKIFVLKKKKSFIVKPKAPYNFDATIFKPSHYPSPLEFYETGKYWFTMRFVKKIFGIKLENKGTVRDPSIKVTVYSKTAPSKTELVPPQLIFQIPYDLLDILLFDMWLT